MKSTYKLTVALFAGAAIGGLAIHGLHAQAKPPIFYVAEIDVTNEEGYAKEYVPKAQAIIKAAGGRFLAVGGAAGGAQVTTIEGAPPKRAVIQVWDSVEKIKAWRANPEYIEARKIGDKYAKFRSYYIEGLPDAPKLN